MHRGLLVADQHMAQGRALMECVVQGEGCTARVACSAALPRSAAVRARGQLDAEVARWCKEIVDKSPTALAIAKRSFNASTEHIRGIGSLGLQALSLYYDTAESKEGVRAFLEKRQPDFRQWTGDSK